MRHSGATAEVEVESHQGTQAQPERKMSEILWGIRWRDHLPQVLTKDGICVDYIDYDEAVPFIQEHYAEIFEDPDDNPFYGGKVTDARGKFYRTAGDFFAFKDDERILGLLVCTPVDWSTYYIRSAALLKDHEGRNLFPKFLPFFFSTLKQAGIERVEAETSPSNMMMIYMLTRQRFNASGTILSERWGVLNRFTKFLDDCGEDVFLRQFCAGRRYQKQERVH